MDERVKPIIRIERKGKNMRERFCLTRNIHAQILFFAFKDSEMDDEIAVNIPKVHDEGNRSW